MDTPSPKTSVQDVLNGTPNSPPLRRCLPQRLWHYTTAQGGEAIVESQHLWATRWNALNDTSELVHALRFLRRAVSQHERMGSLAKLPDMVENVLVQGRKNFLGWYVASLTEAADDLGQWRTYGGGGKGLAIGLDAHRLGVWAKRVGGFLAPVNYSVRDQVLVMIQIVDLVAESFPPEATPNDLDEKLLAWASEIAYLFPILKHRAYATEREWRIIIPLDAGHTFEKPCECRVCIPLLIEGWYLPIKSIRIGPVNELKYSFRELQWVRRLKDAGVHIRCSHIPVR